MAAIRQAAGADEEDSIRRLPLDPRDIWDVRNGSLRRYGKGKRNETVQLDWLEMRVV